MPDVLERPAIHITRWGQSGPRVILVHGGAQGAGQGGERSFARQQALAERGWRVVVPDRPGHGKSPDPGRPDDSELDGVWVADLLEDGAHLVGHSFGGAVALAAAAKRPAAVRSLTLIEPAMHRIATSDPRVRRWLLRIVGAQLLSFSPVTRAKRFLRLVGIPAEMSNLDDAVLARLGRGLRRARIPDGETLERELATTRRAGVPLLVVSGGWSPAFEASADVVAEKGGGKHVVVRSEHHFPQLVSDEFNQLLAAFMIESDAGRSQNREASAVMESSATSRSQP